MGRNPLSQYDSASVVCRRFISGRRFRGGCIARQPSETLPGRTVSEVNEARRRIRDRKTLNECPARDTNFMHARSDASRVRAVKSRGWAIYLTESSDTRTDGERASRNSAAVVVFPLPGRPRRRIAIRALMRSPFLYVATGRVAGSCWAKGNCSLSAPLGHGRASELPARRGRFQDPQRALRRLPTCGAVPVSMVQTEVWGKKQMRGRPSCRSLGGQGLALALW